MGVANLIVLIDNQSNGSLPKEAMIPAATVLLFDAADTLSQGGEKITSQQIGDAYQMMFYGIFSAYGMDEQQTDAAFDHLGANVKKPEADPAGEEPQGMEDDEDE